MTKSIKIEGDDNPILSTSLADILGCFSKQETVHWTLLWITATVKPNASVSIIDFEKSVNHSINGLRLNYSDLKNLANIINQALDILLLGSLNTSNLQRYENEAEMYAKCEYVIELIDASYWEIQSHDYSFLERIDQKLDGTSYII